MRALVRKGNCVRAIGHRGSTSGSQERQRALDVNQVLIAPGPASHEAGSKLRARRRANARDSGEMPFSAGLHLGGPVFECICMEPDA
jgi:hypothetical protein